MVVMHAVPAAALQELTSRLFMKVGAPPHIADDVAQILVGANLAGHDSHGVLRIPIYLQHIQEGKLDPAAEPVIVEEDATTLKIDGQNGFGHYTARRAMAFNASGRNSSCTPSMSNSF